MCTAHTGLARSRDGGRSWVKERVPGKSQPGGPVLEPRRGSSAWDNRVVGTPFVVRMPGGERGEGAGGSCFRMYYIGTGFGEQGETTTGIGCVESVGGSLAEWRRVPPV